MTCTVYKTVKQVGISDKKVKDIVLYTLRMVGRDGELVSIHFVGDAKMKSLNSRYRGVKDTTDVLSFATEEGKDGFGGGDLGDIFVSVPKIKSQAKEYSVSFREELIRMIIHGVLHLSGLDHMEKREAKKMFALQERILEEVL